MKKKKKKEILIQQDIANAVAFGYLIVAVGVVGNDSKDENNSKPRVSDLQQSRTGQADDGN